MTMERVMMILPDVIALAAGGLLTLAISELMQRLVKFKRFSTAYLFTFFPFGLLMPSLIRMLVFPYVGVMSGMRYITTAAATVVAMIFYVGTFCWTVLTDMPNKSRFIYCLTAFYAVGTLFLFYRVSAANGPVIG